MIERTVSMKSETGHAIRFAIIGCGRIAGNHLRAIDQVEGAELVALCDLVPNRSDEMRGANDIPSYRDYKEMLNNHPDIDVVSIMTPSGMHFDHAMDVLSISPKHLVLEKPPVMTLEQGGELAAAAAAGGKTLFPVFQNRHNKAVQRVRQGLENGELGDVVLCTVRLRWCRPQPYYDRDAWRGTFSHDGGALTNQGIHYLDLLHYLGGRVERVQASLKTLGSQIEVEDVAGGLVHFASGALGIIEVTTAARPDDFEASISVLGTKGVAELSGIATNRLVTYTPSPDDCTTYSVDFPNAYGFGHIDLVRNVLAVLREGETPSMPFAEAMETVKFLHALYRSDEEGTWQRMEGEVVSERLGRRDDRISSLYLRPSLTEGESS